MNLFDSLRQRLGGRPRIALPEGRNPIIIAAAERARDFCEPLLLKDDLPQTIELLNRHAADGLVAGIDHTTRNVILSVKHNLGVKADVKTFSSLMVMDFTQRPPLIVADGAVIKRPTADQLIDIIISTNDAAKLILAESPRVAMLSFSTFGSSGEDASITTIQSALKIIRSRRPDILIDGEIQLDEATNPTIAAKKAPTSGVAGRANVLIAPDLNVGNILYKSLEQFGGAHAYGPILLGFNAPVSDLSRGSTVDDVVGAILITAVQADNLHHK